MNGPERSCGRHEQAAAFALHALEPDEAAAVREHLAGCPSCRSVAADAGLVGAALAEAVEQVDPSPLLRATVLSGIARTPQVHRGGPDRTPRRVRAGGTRRTRGAHRPAGGRGAAGPRAARRRGVLAALALTVLVGLAGLGTYAVHVQQQRDALVAQSQALADLLTGLDRPGRSHATLSTSGGETVGVVVADGTTRTVVTAGLPSNDRDSTVYVLWGVGDDAPEPIGAFDVTTGSGADVHRLVAAGGGAPFSGYAISLEPGRVAPAVPTAVVASGQVQA